MKERPGRPEQPTRMKERPIVVLDLIRLAVSAKLIQRETMEAGASDKIGLHHFAGRHRIGTKSKLSCPSSAAEWGFRALAEAVDESAKQGKAQGMRA